MNYLVTGSAGFIGMHVCIKLAKEGHNVFAIDNMNNYYDIRLKKARLNNLKKFSNIFFSKLDFTNKKKLNLYFDKKKIDIIIHLGAQAGVRYSLSHPQGYIDNNITGFQNILDIVKINKIKHLVFASSSSVYGLNNKYPFNEAHGVDHPISIYAVTKRTNELQAHAYCNLFNIAATGLRFFTVYGPWGRPDMSMFIFTKNIIENKKIDIFNNGKMIRDFTYIDDIVESVYRISKKIPNKVLNKSLKPFNSTSRFKIYNIGNNNPVKLLKYITSIEKALKMKAKKNFCKMQMGDVKKTYANVTRLYNKISFKPKTKIEEGVINFVKWYKDFYNY